MLTRTMHFMSWIYHTVPPLFLVITILWPYSCSAGINNPVLTSTPYNITLSFGPNPAATNYTASFFVYNSPFLNDIALEPPYNSSHRLTATYYSVSPGQNYTVGLFENETSIQFRVFYEHITTVPLAPIDVEVQDSGSSYLAIVWNSIQNISYSSHKIYYRQKNDDTWQIREGTADESYSLGGLSPGFLYEIYVTAIAFDFRDGKESKPSTNISTLTLPAPPTNLTAEAENTTHITVTWIPQSSSYQDSFEVKILVQGSNSTTSCQESPCSIVPGPPAGQEVVIFVKSVSHGVSSTAELIRCSTEPDPVAELKAREGVRSLDLSWRVPIHVEITSYHIRVVNIPNNTTREYTKDANQNDTYSLSNLMGGSMYQIFVAAQTPYARGQPKMGVFKTLPEPVSRLKGMAINTTAFQLSWKNPEYTVIDWIIISIGKPDGNSTVIKEDKETSNREVTSLIPGETYQVSVIIHTPLTTMVSEAINVTVTTKPIKPKFVSSISKERSISVTLAREEEIGVFSSIEASLKSSPPQMASTDGVVTFDSLTAGTEYPVEAVTKSKQEKSDVVSVSLYTKPRPPQNLNVDVLNSTAIRVGWEAPDDGGFDNFTVTVEESEGGSQQQVKSTPQFDVEFSGVTAGTTYNVSVVTVKGDQVSRVMQDQNTTGPGCASFSTFAPFFNPTF